MMVPPPRDVWRFYVASGSTLPERAPLVMPADIGASQAAVVRRYMARERARWLPVIPFALRLAAREALRRED